MRFGRFVAAILTASAASHGLASADSKSHPYREIARQNTFRLQTPLRVQTEEIKSPPPPRIILQGIVCLRKEKQVLFKAVAATKPGEPAREFSAILSEGESCGEITAWEINPRTGKVRFGNHGREQWLSLENDSVKPTSSALRPMPFTQSQPAANFGSETR